MSDRKLSQPKWLKQRKEFIHKNPFKVIMLSRERIFAKQGLSVTEIRELYLLYWMSTCYE